MDSETVRHAGREASSRAGNMAAERIRVLQQIIQEFFGFHRLIGDVFCGNAAVQEEMVQFALGFPQVIVPGWKVRFDDFMPYMSSNLPSHDDPGMFPEILHVERWTIRVVPTSLVDQSLDHRPTGQNNDGLLTEL